MPLSLTLSPARAGDIIEYDEMWSFVHDKNSKLILVPRLSQSQQSCGVLNPEGNKQWLWLAVLRRTRQVVAFHIGKRDYIAFEQLYSKVPSQYKECQSRSDFWEAYDNLPKKLHQKCGKETGETSQVESVNNVIRQRRGRYVRKTCSFSKSIKNHVKITGWFLQDYNIERVSVK